MREIIQEFKPLEIVGFVTILGVIAAAMWFFLVMFLPSY